jgi:hypothetical protein
LSTHAPSFGVNNLFAPKFPRIRYLPWFEIGHRISTNLRGHKYNSPSSFFSPSFVRFNGSNPQMANPKLSELLLIHGILKLKWRFWLYSCTSEGFFPPAFFQSLASILLWILLPLSTLKLRFIICLFQLLRTHLTTPVDDKPGFTFLWPMGDADPTEMINLETNRIPFKHAFLNLTDWDGCFRSWTCYVKGWRD